MLKPNKDQLSKENNRIVEAMRKKKEAEALLEWCKEEINAAETWIESHMETVYPTGGQVFLPKEGGRGAMVIVRRLEDNQESHEQDRYIVERLSCD